MLGLSASKNLSAVYNLSANIFDVEDNKRLVNAIEQLIALTGDDYALCLLSNSLASDINSIMERLINLNSAYCYFLAKQQIMINDQVSANIGRLQNAVINSGNDEHCFYFARDVEGADKKIIINALVTKRVGTNINLVDKLVNAMLVSEKNNKHLSFEKFTSMINAGIINFSITN